MAYTFTQKPAPSEPGQLNNFGNLRNDGGHNAMTGAIGNGFQTVDISGIPIVSPATVSNLTVTTITVPLNATQLNLIAITNTVNVSEADATVATKFFTVPTGVIVTLDIALQSVLYLKANTGNATVSFWFTIV